MKKGEKSQLIARGSWRKWEMSSPPEKVSEILSAGKGKRGAAAGTAWFLESPSPLEPGPVLVLRYLHSFLFTEAGVSVCPFWACWQFPRGNQPGPSPTGRGGCGRTRRWPAKGPWHTRSPRTYVDREVGAWSNPMFLFGMCTNTHFACLWLLRMQMKFHPQKREAELTEVTTEGGQYRRNGESAARSTHVNSHNHVEMPAQRPGA